MLVLSRKTGEEIKIGGKITVSVTRIQGNRVYLGIDAPQEVEIRRSEVERRCECPSVENRGASVGRKTPLKPTLPT